MLWRPRRSSDNACMSSRQDRRARSPRGHAWRTGLLVAGLSGAGLLVGAPGAWSLLAQAPPAQTQPLPPVDDLPPTLQPDRPLAAPAGADSPQAQAAVQRHRDLGMRIAGLLKDAERLAARSSTLLGELRALDVERQLQAARAEQAAAALSLIEGDLAALEQRIGELSRRRARETPGVVRRLQRLQRLGRVGYARIVWGTSSAQQLGRAARQMTHMAREDAQRLVTYRDLTVQLTTTEERLQARRTEALELRASATSALAAARAAASERQQLLARVSGQRDEQLRVVQELERARMALDSTVAAYRPAAEGSRGEAPAAPRVAVLPLEQRRRQLPWPARGAVAQPFGQRRDPRFGTTIVRNGIDITAAAGTAVRAVHAGTVAFADSFDGFGRLVIVDHGGGAFSLYGYLSRTLLAQGAPVAAGEVLGEVGEAPTGGPALYFELRVDGRPVDPLQWLQRR